MSTRWSLTKKGPGAVIAAGDKGYFEGYEMFRSIIVAMILCVAGCATTGGPGGQTGTNAQTSPTDILAELQSNPEVQFSEKTGWTIAKLAADGGGEKAWYFPPSSHEANPAVVIQAVTEESGMTRTKTDAICSISQEVCNKLLSDFRTVMEN